MLRRRRWWWLRLLLRLLRLRLMRRLLLLLHPSGWAVVGQWEGGSLGGNERLHLGRHRRQKPQDSLLH